MTVRDSSIIYSVKGGREFFYPPSRDGAATTTKTTTTKTTSIESSRSRSVVSSITKNLIGAGWMDGWMDGLK